MGDQRRFVETGEGLIIERRGGDDDGPAADDGTPDDD